MECSESGIDLKGSTLLFFVVDVIKIDGNKKIDKFESTTKNNVTRTETETIEKCV